MFLTKFADKVIVSVMHDEGIMDCNEIAKGQALANPKMEFIWNTLPDEFVGTEDHLNGVVLKNTRTGDLQTVPVDSCFLFIGYVPNTEIFRDILDMNKPGYLLTNEKMETNIPGVFACGDVRDKFLKQVATAVGDGAIAGYAAEKYLAESEIFEDQIMGSELPGIVFLWNAVMPECRCLLPIVEALRRKNYKRPDVKGYPGRHIQIQRSGRPAECKRGSCRGIYQGQMYSERPDRRNLPGKDRSTD